MVNRIRPNMVKSEDMMSIEDVKNILGIPLIGAIPDNEQVIIASNRGEPIVLEEKLFAQRVLLLKIQRVGWLVKKLNF